MGFFSFIFCDGTTLVLTNTSPVLFLALLLISFIHNTAFKIITSFLALYWSIYSVANALLLTKYEKTSQIFLLVHIFLPSVKSLLHSTGSELILFFDSKILCRSSSLSLKFSAAGSTSKFSSKAINTLAAQCVSLTGNLFVGESI